MNKYVLLSLSLALSVIVHAQNFTGQWKGGFTDKSTSFSGFGGDQCDYVLELECKGNTVTGSSYTYFTDGGKKYYTICKLSGFIDKKAKYIEIKETERTKTNVPINIRNCFQVHKLTYFKHGDTSTLRGNWDPAPNQDGDCGFGTTFLTRRELKQSFPKSNPTASKTGPTKKISTGKAIVATKPSTKTTPAAKKTAPTASLNRKKITEKRKEIILAKPDNGMIRKQIPIIVDSTPATFKESPESIIVPEIKFEKRSNTVLKTIEVENQTVKVSLYDNGEIDGDSISLFYNGKLLLSGKRLSEKPITLTLNVENDTVNELVMYAENLGTIPPNTALMVVNDGARRYEVRITSDLQKSGVINFIHKR